MRVSISEKEKVFVCDGASSDDRAKAIASGFKFNPILNRLETAKIRNAVRLRSHFDRTCEEHINKISCRILDPWPDGISIPTSEKLDRAQRLGVLHALERNHSYIAFEQGVGKTPVAIAIMNSFGARADVLLPPALIPQWFREIDKWKTRRQKVVVVENARDFRTKHTTADILLCPDSIIGDDDIRLSLSLRGASLLITEEAHRFCNWSAARTQTLFGTTDSIIPNGLIHHYEKATYLSGTPMPNRPFELHPVLSRTAANLIDYRDQQEYGIRYCGAYLTNFGWDYKGASNLDELRRKIQPVFMRREEKDTKGFTKKTKSIVYLGGKHKQVIDYQKVVLGGQSIKQFVKRYNKGDVTGKAELGQIAKLRVEIGRRKVPLGSDWTRNILESTDARVILLGCHQETITKMERTLRDFDPVVLHGKTPYKVREQRIQKFQTGKTRLLIANLLVMVGYNMDKGNRVVFFEYSWVPKDNEQAEDRPHRRTSQDDVLIEYLVLENTLDAYMLQSNFKKSKVISQVISKQKE